VSRGRSGLAATAVLSAVAAATTWVAMFSWRGFSTVPGEYLGPLFMLGLVVAGTGTLARWSRWPVVAVVGFQLLVSGMVFSTTLSGSPVPVGEAWTRMVEAFSAASTSAERYAAPVPAHVPGVHPLVIAGGLACLLLVDLLACTLRRAPLAGLPLLTIYSVPVGMVGGGVTWWIFALTAAGFLGMLFLQESEQVARWGRPLGVDPAVVDPTGFGVTTGAVRHTAGTIGTIATALAVVVPLLVPTLSLRWFDFGVGPGGDSDIVIENPMTDLRRDLTRGPDIPLLTMRTDDPTPAYLRISVLNRFSENEWTSGDRDVPTNNRADGPMPDLQGVAGTVARDEFQYSVQTSSAFRSTWLPTMSPISNIVASGDWRYDFATMDFIAGDSDGDLTAADLDYTMTGLKLQLDAEAMAKAPSSSGAVSRDYTQLPPGMPTMVRTLANEVTREAPSRFEKAVALQTWFRETGGFTYDLHTATGNGTDELVAFLTDDEDGRTGYCEQFASAMAVMARILGIPARVAVGFLVPDRIAPGTFEYSAWDLHAWPELFFPGAGWVRFEPTPAGRAQGVPGYTSQDVPVVNPTGGITNNPRLSEEPSRGESASSDPSESAGASSTSDSGTGSWWVGALAGGAGLVVLALLALLPRTLRRSRREQRLGGGPEEAWAELRATAQDLGVPWPEARSPRATRQHLVRYLGKPVGHDTPERPPHGPRVAPEAVRALDRIVRALELSRYAREGGGGESPRADVETCVAALHGGAPRSARRRAEWWPRSVVGTRARRRPRTAERPVEARYGGVVDHVG
jgi:transglutaminase-like putative cysteine protease